MQEEVEHRTVTLAISTTKMSAQVLKSAISKYKELPSFLKTENYLKTAEMQLEDDYGMIDGIVNNGPRQIEPVQKPPVRKEETKSKKPSVLAKILMRIHHIAIII